MNTPGGRDQLLSFGVRNLPLLTRGKEYVLGQNIADVARFVGVAYRDEALAPEVLIGKWLDVLSAAQRYMRQMPAANLDERIIPARNQSIRHMGYHIFRIGHAFLQTVNHGVTDWVTVSMEMPPAEVASGADVAAYGESVKQSLREWWETLGDRSCTRIVRTHTGEIPLRGFLERQTWHSAQHTRQVAATLERLGVAPDGPLTAEQLAGLPLPAALWE